MFYGEEFRVTYEYRSNVGEWLPASFVLAVDNSREGANEVARACESMGFTRNIRVESRIVGPWIAPREPGA